MNFKIAINFMTYIFAENSLKKFEILNCEFNGKTFEIKITQHEKYKNPFLGYVWWQSLLINMT